MKEEQTSDDAQHPDVIVVDTHYLRTQAGEALRAFIAPLAGVYDAAFGRISSEPEGPAAEKTQSAGS